MGEYMYLASEILKYLDSFGTTFSFYTERNRKFFDIFKLNSLINNYNEFLFILYTYIKR